jgi:hypothetical protein
MDTFKIDRSQRMHNGNLVVRVYQVFGTSTYGWDTNKEPRGVARPLHQSLEHAEKDADESIRRDGHHCDESCYAWRPLT